MKKNGILLFVVAILVLVNISLIIKKIKQNFSFIDTPMGSVSGEVQGMEKYDYFCSDGGPFILMPSTLKKQWKGASGLLDAVSPNSDYGKACRILSGGQDGCAGGIINVYDNQVFVVDAPMLAMPKEFDDTAFFIYALVSWQDLDLDGLIDIVKDSIKESDFITSQESFNLNVDGLVFMYAGDVYGNCMYGFKDIVVKTGTYNISEATFKDNDSEVRIFRFSLL